MGMKTGCNLYTAEVMKVPFFRNGVYSGGQLDMQQLLGTLPVASLPPFMQTLVSSLTHLTTQVRVWAQGYVTNTAA